MPFKIDENLPIETSELLRQAGYDAITVPEQHLGGKPDADVASVCREENRALITSDTDFADIRLYPPKDYPGLIVFRLRRQDKPHVFENLQRLLPLLSSEPLNERLWIVEEGRLRIRD